MGKGLRRQAGCGACSGSSCRLVLQGQRHSSPKAKAGSIQPGPAGPYSRCRERWPCPALSLQNHIPRVGDFNESTYYMEVGVT